MAKLTIKQAIEIIPESESTLRRAIKTGEISSEKDHNGHRLIDAAELQRGYGQLKSTEQPDESANNTK